MLERASTVTQYRYNLDKQLTQVLRPDSQAVDLSYDFGARLSTIDIPRGQYRYAYHPATAQLQTITAPDSGTLSFAYDAFLLTDRTWSGEVRGSISDTYDNNFRVTERAVNGERIAYGYDNDGLLTQAGALTLDHSTQNGLIEGSTMNDVVTSRSYNGFGELASHTARVGGNTLYEVAYTRDKLGRIVTKTETIEGVTGTLSYDYDRAIVKSGVYAR